MAIESPVGSIIFMLQCVCDVWQCVEFAGVLLTL